YVYVGGPVPGTASGIAESSETFRDWISAWEEWRVHVDEIRELDAGRVFVLVHASVRGKESGVELPARSTNFAQLFEVGDGRVTRLVNYFDRGLALAELGLSE